MFLKLIVFGLCIIILILLATKKNFFRSRSAYNGNWNGTYIGETDSGAWSIIIGFDGKVTGTVISSVTKTHHIVSGVVDGKGAMEIHDEGKPVLFFKGNLDLNTTLAAGSWENQLTDPVTGGNWNGSKFFG